jgi:hypothetical protein
MELSWAEHRTRTWRLFMFPFPSIHLKVELLEDWHEFFNFFFQNVSEKNATLDTRVRTQTCIENKKTYRPFT